MGSLEHLRDDLFGNLTEVSQGSQPELVLFVEEVLLGSGGSHDSFEVLDSFLLVVEDGESLLVVLLLLPFVTSLLQFLHEEAVVKVVILASSLGLFLLLLSKSIHSPGLVLLAE